MKNEFTVFSWTVIETTSKPFIDIFLLVRYTPALTDRLQLFTQLESINGIATEDNGTNNFIQRYRLGLKINDWQFGLGGDFSQAGNTNYTSTTNTGIFLRHVFQ